MDCISFIPAARLPICRNTIASGLDRLKSRDNRRQTELRWTTEKPTKPGTLMASNVRLRTTVAALAALTTSLMPDPAWKRTAAQAASIRNMDFRWILGQRIDQIHRTVWRSDAAKSRYNLSMLLCRQKMHIVAWWTARLNSARRFNAVEP